jgi:hypothetical protein
VPSGAIDKISLPDGSVWLAGSSKLLHFERDRWIDFGKDLGIGRFGVFSIPFDREGNIGSLETRGYPYFAKRKGNWMTFPIKSNLSDSMAQSRDGVIWISDA